MLNCFHFCCCCFCCCFCRFLFCFCFIVVVVVVVVCVCARVCVLELYQRNHLSSQQPVLASCFWSAGGMKSFVLE